MDFQSQSISTKVFCTEKVIWSQSLVTNITLIPHISKKNNILLLELLFKHSEGKESHFLGCDMYVVPLFKFCLYGGVADLV